MKSVENEFAAIYMLLIGYIDYILLASVIFVCVYYMISSFKLYIGCC